MPDAQQRHRVFDHLVPADDWPALSQAGLDDHLTRLADDPITADRARRIADLVATVGAAPDVESGLDALDGRDRWLLVSEAANAYYGTRDGAGARMVGFVADGVRPPSGPTVEASPTVTGFGAVQDAYDVVIIGAGAGGGVVAAVLAEAGASVLVVERGRSIGIADDPRDHLRNHRSNVHGHNTGPDRGNPRVLERRDGTPVTIEHSHDPRWHNNAMAVGGGTRVYMGMAWRFLPDDFTMASRYGVPDDSSLADWPLSYDDLEPHYDWVEWEVGVCGDDRTPRAAGRRRRGYPMPPLPPNSEAQVLAAGAGRLGLMTGPVPLLLNSMPYGGRQRCVRCGECVGFTCPVDAKNGSHNTMLPRAVTAGADLVASVRAVRVTTTAGGVDGVDVVEERTGAARHVRAGHVVVAAGAIETARLLLASRADDHPDGLGNTTDQVGRHLQGHGFTSIFGRHPTDVIDPEGPGVTIATLDVAHGNRDDDGDVVGGGVLANEITKLPIVHWNWALPPDAARTGLAGKAAMRDSFRTTSHLFGQIQETPRADNRVTLDPSVRDALGQPVARLAGHAHPETIRAATAVAGVGRRWHEASGATEVWTDPCPTGLLAGQHQAGTCRMGTDASCSVTGPDGRVHGHDNLWIADGSVHVTNGSVNPSLTIMALAHRLAERLAGS